MNIEQGEIWEVEFFPNAGSEMGKKRPALIVNHPSIGKLPLRTIVPITHWSETYRNYPWMIKLVNSPESGLSKISAADCFQIRNFSHHRFIQKIGEIESDLLREVHEIILKTLNPEYTLC
ncbi:MAG: type II toxin-antitoxin system PemK/MazF family toxin [Campylobacterota bacterium]|nr:type II toxin-antitoxin system PemK/MazF family toxin [Campylobacterota bacterium]